MNPSPCCSGYILRMFISFGVFECENCHKTYKLDEIISGKENPQSEQEKKPCPLNLTIPRLIV